MAACAEEAVGDDAEATEHHQPTSEHRIEQVAREGIEYTSRHGDGDEVVDARPEEVLMNGPESRACQMEEALQGLEVGATKRHHRSLHRQITPTTHRYRESARAKAAASLMPSPTIATPTPFHLQTFDEGRFLLGTHAVYDTAYPDSFADGTGGTRPVACEHNDLQPSSTQ